MFFIVPGGNKNKVPIKILKDIEKYLIQLAIYNNSKLSNIANTKNLPKWGIAGILRTGKGKNTKASQLFKKMLKL